MGETIVFRQRNPYLRDIELMLAKQVEEADACQIGYACADRETAGKLSRWLRGEIKRRGWPAIVRQFRTRVFVWRVLSEDEEERVMRQIGEVAANLVPWRTPLQLVPPPRR